MCYSGSMTTYEITKNDRVLIQVILTVPDIPRNHLIAAVAKASALAFLNPENDDDVLDRWDQWMRGGHFRKSVRKVKRNQFSALSQELGWATADNVAMASDPQFIDELPRKVRSAQVTGWDSQVLDSARVDSESKDIVTIYINSALNMTAGKAAAQAAHALTLLCARRQRMINSDTHIRVIETDLSENIFNGNIDEDLHVVIHDAGFTEIPSGSLTAVIFDV